MSDEHNEKKRITLMLLQESLWKIEDKLSVIVESLADHEAELIRLRRFMTKATQRFQTLDARYSKSKMRKPDK